MAETLCLAVAGLALGLGWSLLGLYLSSLASPTDPAAGRAIKGLFLATAIMFHGFIRSRTPRLFVFVLLLAIVNCVNLLGTAQAVTAMVVTQIAYPMLLAVGLSLTVNICIFPEFSSAYLGGTTIRTLDVTVNALRAAGKYFVEVQTLKDKSSLADVKQEQLTHTDTTTLHRVGKALSGQITKDSKFEPEVTSPPAGRTAPTLNDLLGAKSKIRPSLAGSKKAQRECNFELAWSVLPPRNLRPVSDTSMSKLATNVIAVIGACESKFALLGEDSGTVAENNAVSGRNTEQSPQREKQEDGSTSKKEEGRSRSERKKSKQLEHNQHEIDLIKPKREIEFGDVQLLRFLLQQIAQPYINLQAVLDCSVDCVTSCVAYAYVRSVVPFLHFKKC